MFDLCLALLMVCGPAPAAKAPPVNPQIDYPGFKSLTLSVEDYRRQRLVDWDGFAAAAREPDALILDARSERQFAAGHLQGAVNLPLPEFSEEALAEIIGRTDRPILIYCNNNFRNDRPPVMLKSMRLALNLSTFTHLYGYGYRNVRELNDVMDFNDPRVRWVTNSAPASASQGRSRR